MPPVEIQWCDHSSVLLEYLRQLYEEGRFVDVGLECEGRQVKAHKAVISACSPYLEGLLKGNPARSHLIKFNGYSYTSLRAIIDFMYNGKVMIEQDNLAAFLKLGRALQVRGILDIASQCEEAGLTTPDEKGNTVSQNRNQAKSKAQNNVDSKKYAYMLDKNSSAKKTKRGQTNIIGSVEQQPIKDSPNTASQQQATQQQQVSQMEVDGQETTLEELQQALASGQAIIQTADGNVCGEETLQMAEGQCVITGSGQTYVVVQEGDNLSFVPAEMVQGDLQTNGEEVQTEENVNSHDETGNLDTMSVVESLVKLGQKQPIQNDETPEIGPDMPDIGSDADDAHTVKTTTDKAIKNNANEKRIILPSSEGKNKKMKNL